MGTGIGRWALTWRGKLTSGAGCEGRCGAACWSQHGITRFSLACRLEKAASRVSNFQGNCCHGLGLGQSVTTISLKIAHTVKTPSRSLLRKHSCPVQHGWNWLHPGYCRWRHSCRPKFRFLCGGDFWPGPCRPMARPFCPWLLLLLFANRPPLHPPCRYVVSQRGGEVVVARRKSAVGYGAVWGRGLQHRVGECEAVLGCDGTDVERPFWDAKRDGPS